MKSRKPFLLFLKRVLLFQQKYVNIIPIPLLQIGDKTAGNTQKLLSVFLVMILVACMLFSVSAFATYPPIYVSGDDYTSGGGNPPMIISGSDADTSGSSGSSYPAPVQTPVVVQQPSSGSGPKLVGGPLVQQAGAIFIRQTEYRQALRRIRTAKQKKSENPHPLLSMRIITLRFNGMQSTL